MKNKSYCVCQAALLNPGFILYTDITHLNSLDPEK